MASTVHPHVNRLSVADAPVREKLFHRVLLTLMGLAALGLAAHLAVMLWAQHELTPVEAAVGLQSRMLYDSGRIYYDLKHYPFTVTSYGPIFYVASGALQKIGLPLYLSGRLISFAALLWSLALLWQCLGWAGLSRAARMSALLLAGSTANIAIWGTVGQVDVLACAFSLAGFNSFFRFQATGQRRAIILSGIFVVLAVFTKQTSVSAAAAIAVFLMASQRKQGTIWTGCTVSAGIFCALGLNALTHGGYLISAVRANANPLSFLKFAEHAKYLLLTGTGVILVAAAGLFRTAQTPSPATRKVLSLYAFYIYAGFCILIWLATSPKIGSDLNYQVEMMFALCMCAGVALDRLEFFDCVWEGRQSWVTLLQMPLLLHVILNLAITVQGVLTRAILEPVRAQETAALAPYLKRSGRVFSVHYDGLAIYRKDIEVEPYFYWLLVEAKVADSYPVQHDFEMKQFATVLLHEDIWAKPEARGLEDAVMPEPQLRALRANYHLAAKIPGPYDIHVYEPNPN